MRGVRVTQFEDLTEPDGKYAYWAGVIGFEEKTTGDSRIIEKGALRLDTLPVPFRWSKEDHGGHDGVSSFHFFFSTGEGYFPIFSVPY